MVSVVLSLFSSFSQFGGDILKTHAAGGGVEKNDDCFGLPLAAAQEELDSTFFLARFDLSVPLRLWAETGSRNRAAETS